MDATFLDKWCRTCLITLTNTEHSLSLFDTNVNEVVGECLSIQVDSSENMPVNICQRCFDYINTIQNFRKTCIQNDIILRKSMRINRELDSDHLDKLCEQLHSKVNDFILPAFKVSLKEELEEESLTKEDWLNQPIINSEPMETSPRKRLITKKKTVTKRKRRKLKVDSDDEDGKISSNGSDRESFDEENDPANIDCGLNDEQTSENESSQRLKKERKDLQDIIDNLDNEYFYASNSNEWHCKMCDKTMTRFDRLRRHVVEQHNVSPEAVVLKKPQHNTHKVFGSFKCIVPKCQKAFPTLQSFVNHMGRAHKKTKRHLKCYICDTCFFLEEQIDKHILLYHLRNAPVMVDAYICPVKECAMDFGKSLNRLAEHCRNVHDYDKIKIIQLYQKYRQSTKKETLCQVCGSYEVDLRRHMRNHHLTTKDGKAVNLKCKYCLMEFESRQALAKHRKRKHKKNKICHYCGVLYSGQEHLLMHESKENGGKIDGVKKESKDDETGKKYICNVCNRSMKTETILRTHMRVVHEPVYVECDLCHIKLKKYSMGCHIKYFHQNVRQHQCSVCGDKFKKKWDLQGHFRLHTDERPYSCAYCSQCFRDARSHKHHQMRHTGEKPHVCGVCDKRFIQKTALKTHMKTHSGQRAEAKELFCSVCAKTFREASALSAHMSTHVEKVENEGDGVGVAYKLDMRDVSQPIRAGLIQPTNNLLFDMGHSIAG